VTYDKGPIRSHKLLLKIYNITKKLTLFLLTSGLGLWLIYSKNIIHVIIHLYLPFLVDNSHVMFQQSSVIFILIYFLVLVSFQKTC